MITLYYRHLNDPMFIQAVTKLSSHGKFPVKTAYAVSKITSQLQNEMDSARRLFGEMLTKYAVKPETGNPEDPAKKAEFEKEQEEFMSIQIQIQQMPLKLEELEGVGLSPNQLTAMEAMLETASVTPMNKSESA